MRHPLEVSWQNEVIRAVPWEGNGIHWPEVVAEIAREEVERQQRLEEAA
jgi:hypothetical protein